MNSTIQKPVTCGRDVGLTLRCIEICLRFSASGASFGKFKSKSCSSVQLSVQRKFIQMNLSACFVSTCIYDYTLRVIYWISVRVFFARANFGCTLVQGDALQCKLSTIFSLSRKKFSVVITVLFPF